MKDDPLLKSPLELIPGLATRNRVVVPPMASGTADPQGFVTEKTLDHYKRLTSTGAGIVFVEYSYIQKSGKSEPKQLGIDESEKLGGLKKLAKLIHEGGALAGMQITHCGGKSEPQFTGGELLGPSALAVPAKDRSLGVMRALAVDEIVSMIEAFYRAATLAYQAGFDIVELHCAHGYGLNQWLSPLTNKRQDQYGGSCIKRFRIVGEIIERIRGSFPNKILAARIPGQDHFSEGLTLDDGTEIARSMESLGVNLIDVSSGIGGWRRPGNRDGEGYLVPDSEYIKKSLSIPVIGVGGIKTSTYVNHGIRNHLFDLAAIGRGFLEDPQLMKTSLQET